MRGWLLSGLLALGIALGACRSGTTTAPAAPLAFVENAARHPERPLVAVLTPPSQAVEPLVTTLRSELGADFDVFVATVDSKTSDEKLAAWLDAQHPHSVVLVDNPTVHRYARWAHGQNQPPAAIIVMASFAEGLYRTLPNATAIAFEPPAVSMLTDLRRILDKNVKRAGVIYRPSFGEFVRRESKRASVEKIELLAIEVPADPTPRELTRALHRLQNDNIEVLWVTNDNRLLTPELLSHAWLPFAESAELPIAVGVPSLVRSEPHFGTYAAVADIEALGVQTADLIFELGRLGFIVGQRPIQPALSFKTYLDVEQARELGMKPAAELLVDQLVQESKP